MRLCCVLPITMCVLLFFSGCSDSGPKVARVTGTVMMDGSPLADAIVSFEPTGPGRPSIGNTDANGYYRLQYTTDLDGALLGTHTVRISTKQFVYNEDVGDDRPRPERVPPKYNIESSLNAIVESGGSEIDFDLNSDGFKPKNIDFEDFD
ncbi:carboxypeptidase-like regulatory domain-containing protein [Gimesia aquarii]|uniref:Carboxypeptidase regulatory-like domain-containing protein n=1 Tax=Gimesia aquarii TaxID=2527964 RepID=A0A517WZY5_9PLAN|nr:carboxypeptidase-like regulatory domain-containing protein [Gimesia aquarii]QDU10816.1 hypothetical protein V202x_42290 [Gimesia aquarii]